MNSNKEKLSIDSVKNSILDSVNLLFEAEAISVSGHANISVKQGDNIVITNTGNVRNLTAESFVVIDYSGKVLQGVLEDTNAEILAMHTEVYKQRSDVGAIIHTHASNLTAFALAHQSLKVRYEPLIRFGQAIDIPVVPWAPRGTKESVDGIISAVSASDNLHAVLLANHGVLAFGSDANFTATFLVALEEAAQEELKSIALGGAKDFPTGALERVQKEMRRES